MKVFDNTKKKIFLTSWVSLPQTEPSRAEVTQLPRPHSAPFRFDLLRPVRRWLDNIQVSDRQIAHRICQIVPAQCPFERDVKLFGKVLFHIPPMCKLNPLYEEVIGLRFRALCYLADECGEDISQYC
jgi:hypothetical protein